MKRSEAIGLTTIALIGVAALVMGRYAATSVEAEAAERTQAALLDVGFSDIALSVDGAVVELSGQVRSDAEKAALDRRIAAVEGLDRIVDSVAVVAPLVDLRPSVLRIQNDGQTLTLTGEAPNAEARDLLSARLDMAGDDRAVANLMRAQDRRASNAWMAGAEAAIGAVATLRVGEATLERGALRIIGAAPDAETRDRVIADLRRRLRGVVDLSFDIDAPPPLISPYAFIARNSASDGFVVEACAAPTAAERSSVLGALVGADASSASADAVDLCPLANGAPNGGWTEAVIRAIAALSTLSEGEARLLDDRIELIGFVAEDADIDRARAALASGWPADYAVNVDVAPAPAVRRPFELTIVKRPGDVRLSGYAPSRERAVAWAETLDALSTLELARGAPAGFSQAATAVVDALAATPVGAATLTDRSFLVAAPGDAADRARFRDRLARALPDGYALQVVAAREPSFPSAQSATASDAADAPGSADASAAGYVFSARRVEDGRVELVGVAPNAGERAVVEAYARAMLGGDALAQRVALSADPPPLGWRSAVFAGLEALAELDDGELTVEASAIFLRGRAGSASAARRAAEAFAGAPAEFAPLSRIRVVELGPEPGPDAALGPRLSASACLAELNAAVAAEPIVFDSGRATIDAGSRAQIDALSMLLRRCPTAPIEVGGHTDARGSDDANLALSQQRATAVRLSLIAQGVAPDRLTAVGYGEAQPIADNDTEEGRARNRRIAFQLADLVADGDAR